MTPTRTVKAIALLARRPEWTRDQFIVHYENVHVPLVRRAFPQIRRYRRNFVDSGTMLPPGGQGPGFDVLTEMWFDSRADYDAMLAAHADPAVGGPVAEDAVRFIDMDKTIQFLVDLRGDTDTPV
ncbi:EthD domain-containing protein [Tomitella gaofuii]|uniref:EthD domain-containing protein n=1 Tax=Tomitella gaofuii TaxID=2760083 RepID=UPI0015F92469|nr:EthD domain-containing protein [Tomitella gaofuii]